MSALAISIEGHATPARERPGRRRFAGVTQMAIVAIAALASACGSKQTPAASTSITSGEPVATFTFAPPSGTHYVRTLTARNEAAVVGAPFRAVDERELTWDVNILAENDEVVVRQRLQKLTATRDGKALIDGKALVDRGVALDVVMNRSGRVTEVRGTEALAKTIQAFAAPGREELVARVFSAENLRDVVADRFDQGIGDIVGRPARPGSSWSRTGNATSAVIRHESVTVERLEPCDGATCARLRMDYDIDPDAVAAFANAYVKDFAVSAGADPRRVSAEKTRYDVRDAVLVEPATMLPHGIESSEVANVTVVTPEGRSPLEISTRVTQTYRYLARGGVASADVGSPVRAVAAP